MNDNCTNTKKLYSFRFDQDLIDEIDQIAKNSHRTRTQLLTDLMVSKLSHSHTNKPISQPLN